MGSNKDIEKLTDISAKKIDMPFTFENLEILLNKIISKEGLTFSNQDFVNWCEDFFWKMENNDHSSTDDPQNSKYLEILNDISVQWELYLDNTYSFEELQKLDFSNVVLPYEWFQNWLNKIRNNK